MRVDPLKRPSMRQLVKFPGVWDMVCQLQTSSSFHEKMHETLRRRINFGWANKTEMTYFKKLILEDDPLREDLAGDFVN